MTVVPALDLAALGGRRGRPAPRVADLGGLYVAGDWVGAEGLLADASLASGRAAAQEILRDTRPAAAGDREHAGHR